ncbi:hypothetical protein N431DRAFT_427157 [Stipitochalara longipes BDJ]|nr:hypothetical protein N431DRAFT_427157 [Stipitochalara longipes BDJ]
MSSTSTSPEGEGNGFPFNDESQSSRWPILSIIGVVLTVVAFIAVVWFIFWIFRRERKLRQRSTADERPISSDISRQEQPLPMLHRYC